MSGRNYGKNPSGGNGQSKPTTDNYPSGSSSGYYSTGQSVTSYPQQQPAAVTPPSSTYQYPTPSANATGGSSGEGVPKEGAEDWAKLKVNPKGYVPAPSDWEKLHVFRAATKKEIAPFWRGKSGKAKTGFLIPDNYQVGLEFMAEGSKGPWLHPSGWLTTGLRLHNFTKNFPELVCKWIFTRAMNPDGLFINKWGRVFGRIAPAFLEDGASNAWYYEHRDAEWEEKNPYGLHCDYPFDGGAETTRAKQKLKGPAQPPSNPSNQAPSNTYNQTPGNPYYQAPSNAYYQAP